MLNVVIRLDDLIIRIGFTTMMEAGAHDLGGWFLNSFSFNLLLS